jgi:hypothetical protein
MPVPDYQSLMLPVLKLAAKGETRVPDIEDKIADEFGLTTTEREQLQPGGRRILQNRIHWAKLYMVRAGLIDEPQHGRFVASQEGRALLARNPVKINVDFLREYPRFRDWYRGGQAGHRADGPTAKLQGVVAEQGEAAESESAEALKRYRSAADQGSSCAQYNLGFMYAEGRGVPQDDAEAVKWFRHAADQGHAHAQYNLGAMYAEGCGVPQDESEALQWYRRAAGQGYPAAQFALGTMYAEGRGVPQDDAEAVQWYLPTVFANLPVASPRPSPR